MSINHFATNLVTKGLLNMSNITKGMVIIGYEIIRKKKGGGGSGAYDGGPSLPYKKIYDERELYDDISKYDDIDIIKVKVNWEKKYKGPRLIEAKLIKTHIEAQILKETGKSITVELI
jgi:hypothetical protein